MSHTGSRTVWWVSLTGEIFTGVQNDVNSFGLAALLLGSFSRPHLPRCDPELMKKYIGYKKCLKSES